MFFPKKVKYRRWQRMRSNPNKKRVATRGISLDFGEYGLKATTPYRIRSEHLESARRVIVRTTGKEGRVWIRIFPNRPWTKKAAEVGMGKGKGDPQGYEAQIWPGKILFELSGVSEDKAREALTKASKKLPVKTKFVIKN